MRLSGLQRGVLSLYRQCLREIEKKPAVCHLPYEVNSLSKRRKTLTCLRTYEKISRALPGRCQLKKYLASFGLQPNAVLRRTEFEKSIGLDKKDFAAIEYLLRKGQRQLEIYKSPGIRNIMR